MPTCVRCVLDSETPYTNLVFDGEGVCNNCRAYEVTAAQTVLRPIAEKQRDLVLTIEKIKKSGQGKSYDCILGVSGGVDSTYLAYLSKEWGLRPLVVHFDNGWNSELAVNNIQNIVDKLGYHLFTYVIDWEEFKDLQLSYLKASVIDIEVPTDHFIYATLYELAHKHKIKYILDGNNLVTEFAKGSWRWGFSKLDLKNLTNIHKEFGMMPLRKFPKLGFVQRLYYRFVSGIETVRPLDFIPYNKKDVKDLISKELGWRDYGGKHYESIFTRFYQGYILLTKFGIDKRKGHLSNLIWSGQISKGEALAELQHPPYEAEMFEQDLAFVLKKFGLSKEEFEELMNRPTVPHEYYGTERNSSLAAKFVYYLHGTGFFARKGIKA
jgi:N-acetyl sugar amidotransferase